jgi:hypothetical protein
MGLQSSTRTVRATAVTVSWFPSGGLSTELVDTPKI